MLIFEPKMRYLGLGRCLKSFLEVVHFIVTKYGTVGSYGDPIHTQNHGLGTEQMVLAVESGLLLPGLIWDHLRSPGELMWAHLHLSGFISDHLESSGVICACLGRPWRPLGGALARSGGDPGALKLLRVF